MATKELEPKQALFVQEYLIDLNATQAAIRAGYSEKTAKEQGYQLLHKTSLVEAIAEAQEERARRTEIDQDRVVKELGKVAFANMGDFISRWDDGSPRVHLPENPESLAVVSEVTIDNVRDRSDDKDTHTERVRFKLHDKLSALDKLARHLGVYNDKVDHKLTADDALTKMLARLAESPKRIHDADPS